MFIHIKYICICVYVYMCVCISLCGMSVEMGCCGPPRIYPTHANTPTCRRPLQGQRRVQGLGVADAQHRVQAELGLFGCVCVTRWYMSVCCCIGGLFCIDDGQIPHNHTISSFIFWIVMRVAKPTPHTKGHTSNHASHAQPNTHARAWILGCAKKVCTTGATSARPDISKMTPSREEPVVLFVGWVVSGGWVDEGVVSGRLVGVHTY